MSIELVSAGIVFGVLIAAGARHLWKFESFMTTVRAHRIIPGAFVRAGAVLTVVVEISIGAIGATAVTVASDALLTRASVAAALLLLMYALYLAVLVRVRPEASCGCGASEQPVNWMHVFRAGLLSLLAVVGSRTTPISYAGSSVSDFILIAAVTAGVGAIIWISPDILLSANRLSSEARR